MRVRQPFSVDFEYRLGCGTCLLCERRFLKPASSESHDIAAAAMPSRSVVLWATQCSGGPLMVSSLARAPERLHDASSTCF